MMSEPTASLNFIKRKRGTVLLHKGYQYYQRKQYKSGPQLWRCAEYKTKCKGTITIKENEVLKEKLHQCAADYGRNEVAVTMAKLKEEVSQSSKPITQLYTQTLQHVEDKGLNLVANIPSFSSVQHSLYDSRNKTAQVSKTVFIIAEEVQVPIRFNDFVLADYYYEGNRILIFCSPETRSKINNFSEFFGDATFDSCPSPFKQLYTIHGDFGSTIETTNVQPLIYALLINKSESTYKTLFEIIKSQLPDFDPQLFHCDFELAAINALVTTFPTVQIIGCFYHWHRCIWKKAKSLKHIHKPDNRIVGLVAALPLLPYNNILDAFQYIKSESEDLSMGDFLKYVEKTWMIPKIRKLISVFGKRHRTNNVLESWHSKINKIMKKYPVTLMRLLETLYTESQKQITGRLSPKRRQTLIKRDDYIMRVQMQLINNEISLELALEKLR